MKNQSLRQVIHILIMIFFYKDIDLCIIYTQIECLLQIYIEICQWITKQIVVCQRDSCQMHRQIDYRDGWIEKQIKIEIEIQIDRQIDRQTNRYRQKQKYTQIDRQIDKQIDISYRQMGRIYIIIVRCINRQIIQRDG